MPHETDRLPDCERAYSFQSFLCGDPHCGLHVVAHRSDNTPICEIVIGRGQLLKLLDYIHDHGLDL
jgi:hypothetical protein